MYGPRALAAWAVKYETDPARRTVALEQLYGRLVDEVACKQLLVDETSLNLTLEAMDQVADAFVEMANRRLTSLDFADPFGADYRRGKRRSRRRLAPRHLARRPDSGEPLR